ncbi:MAG: cohesin domain-containing protein [Chloroflexota bacterium]
MKFKPLFQTLTLVVLLFSLFSAGQPVQAQPATDVQIVPRETTYWNATFTGTVNGTRYEQWALVLTEADDFVITATTTSGDLVPLITLLDASENPLASLAGSLTSSQPAGNYYILIQPQSGSGDYEMTIRQTQAPVEGTSASVSVNPSSISVDGTAIVTVGLSDLPEGGLASVEFTCTYDATLIGVSAITDAGLFGADSAMAVNGPASGMFIVALAGSNGQKATTSGPVFTFTATGLQLGDATITCTARVSTGDNTLTELQPASATLSIVPPGGTLAGTVLAYKPVTVGLYDAGSVLVTSVVANEDGTFSLPAPAGTYTAVATAEGYLDAQGAAVITSGNTTTMPTVTLLAGDIDGNDVIDQYDAMTIGMNYNGYLPTAADLNDDGTINVLDLELLAANYRQSGALAWQ